MLLSLAKLLNTLKSRDIEVVNVYTEGPLVRLLECYCGRSIIVEIPSEYTVEAKAYPHQIAIISAPDLPLPPQLLNMASAIGSVASINATEIHIRDEGRISGYLLADTGMNTPSIIPTLSHTVATKNMSNARPVKGTASIVFVDASGKEVNEDLSDIIDMPDFLAIGEEAVTDVLTSANLSNTGIRSGLLYVYFRLETFLSKSKSPDFATNVRQLTDSLEEIELKTRKVAIASTLQSLEKTYLLLSQKATEFSSTEQSVLQLNNSKLYLELLHKRSALDELLYDVNEMIRELTQRLTKLLD